MIETFYVNYLLEANYFTEPQNYKIIELTTEIRIVHTLLEINDNKFINSISFLVKDLSTVVLLNSNVIYAKIFLQLNILQIITSLLMILL